MEVRNYRPVSLLCSSGKSWTSIEHFLCNHLTAFLEKKQLFPRGATRL
ncbi:unnamed protein product [Ixodes hexagonus]